MYRLSALWGVVVLAVAIQIPAYSPAQLRAGKVPAIPVTAAGGGEVLLDLDVSAEGTVTRATPLRSTPPFTEFLMKAVSEWQFFPARQIVDPDRAHGGEPTSRVAVRSNVLVAAVFRPPSLQAPTIGEPPKDVSSALNSVPFPLVMVPPLFPPNALNGGVVLLEVRVSAGGSVDQVGVINSAPPFDDAAIAVVRQWRFRPALTQGTPVPAIVYVVFGFRPPS